MNSPTLRIALAAAALSLLGVLPALAEDDEIDTCMTCHADKTLSKTLSSGESVSLYVDRDELKRSVHGGNLKCTECHAGMEEIPHPERPYKTAAEFHLSFLEACKSCHYENVQQSLDGVHESLRAKGTDIAPTCLECHGSHGIAKASEPRSRISETCSACHSDIYDRFVKSVHGKSLVADGNPDVPVCTDCHRSHDIADPRTEAWLLQTPELCGKCHTDAERMKKYGLSTNVVASYFSDFHGMSASLRQRGKAGRGQLTALCIDCHGIHDIAAVHDAESPVLKANLTKTCAKCHEGAGANFPGAWLSHYEPSWSKAPLAYGVKVFYVVFIPFVIGGLCLQILLSLWRVVVNR